jgi:hypothetical protein
MFIIVGKKHLDIQGHYVRDMVAIVEVQFQSCSTLNMCADALTKCLPGLKHMQCIKALGLGNSSCDHVGVLNYTDSELQSNLSYCSCNVLQLQMFR